MLRLGRRADLRRAGFVRGVQVGRIYREAKVNAIGAGTEEIMKDLGGRQVGF